MKRDSKGKFLPEEIELKDEPWIDENGDLWIISPNGKARKT